MGKLLTGYTPGAGVIASTDNILQAIQKLAGNMAAITHDTLHAARGIKTDTLAGLVRVIADSTYITDSIIAKKYFLSGGGNITGTGGAGFIGLIPQSVVPSTPASGVKIYARSTGAFSWIGTNGFTRSFLGSNLTGDHAWQLQNRDGTFADSADVAANTAAIASNSAAIASNSAAITSNTSAIALKKNANDSVGNAGFTPLDQLNKTRDSIMNALSYDNITHVSEVFRNNFYTSNNSPDFSLNYTGTAAANNSYAAEAAHPSILAIQTGATTATYANGKTNIAAVMFGGGAWVYETTVKLPVLSISTDRYQCLYGFMANFVGVNQTDAVYFLYDEGGTSTGSAASGNWQLVTANNNARTFSTTTVTIAAATWYKLRAEVNAAGTSVNYYINGTLAGTTTTNIPASRATGVGFFYNRSIGTTNMTFLMDYITWLVNFTTPR